MDLAWIALKQMIIMFVIVIIGMICYKRKNITEESNKSLSAIVLNIVNPAVILVSYQEEFNTKLMLGFLYSLLMAAISFLIAILISTILMPKMNNKDYNIERVSITYSNCGFIGIPLVNALVGPVGIFYLASYLSIFNLLLWTHGVSLMSREGKKFNLKSIISPCIIAVIVGLLFFVLQIRLPEVLKRPIELIAGMNTPLAMMAAGVSIAQTKLFASLKKRRVYYISIIKLILVPSLFIVAFLPFSLWVDKNILITILIATACPVGASGTLFAIRYNGNAAYASELFGVTTILSAISIPFIMVVSSLVLS